MPRRFTLRVGTGDSPPAPSGTLLADVRWTTATGSTSAALTDSGNANRGGVTDATSGANIASWGCSHAATVVDGSGVGLPAGLGNAVRITYNTSYCFHLQWPHLFPLPADGTDHYWAMRFWTMNATGQTATEQHPHCFWPAGIIEGTHLSYDTGMGSGGSWTPHPWFSLNNSANATPFSFGVVPKPGGSQLVVAADAWVCYEWIMHWRSATEYQVRMRLHDASGALLADVGDWCHTDTLQTLESWQTAGNWVRRRSNSGGADRIRTVSLGNGQQYGVGGYFYFAAARMELRTGPQDWIGTGL